MAALQYSLKKSAHYLSCSFIFFHFLSFLLFPSFSFMFLHFLSFSFISFHVLSFSFIVFLCFPVFFFFFLGCSKSSVFLPRLPHDFLFKLLCKKSFFLGRLGGLMVYFGQFLLWPGLAITTSIKIIKIITIMIKITMMIMADFDQSNFGQSIFSQSIFVPPGLHTTAREPKHI